MSAIAKNTTSPPSLGTLLPPFNDRISGLVAGMTLDNYDACYIDASTGQVFASKDTGATAAQAQVHGYASRSYLAGQAMTLIYNVEVPYAAGTLTPGASAFLSAAVAGGLDTASQNSHGALGFATNANTLFLRQRLL
jgi:hypothetical protein